jgi:hypothetical protein
MKRRKGTLRLNAARAKTRLVSGYWNEKQISGAEREPTGNNYAVYFSRDDDEEEILYRRVAAQIRLGNGDNLLGSVLDRKHMATLGEAERERYVFNMSALVQKSVERYNKVC